MSETAKPEPAEVDPEDFLRAMLRISPKDAAEAREDAARAAEHRDRDEEG